MTISENFVNIIESFEGFSSVVYYDGADLPTIGYGTYVDMNSEYINKEINKEDAFILLKDELYDIEFFINTIFYNKNITQNMYDALCLFTYYNGIHNFKRSYLIRKILYNPYDYTIKTEFMKLFSKI